MQTFCDNEGNSRGSIYSRWFWINSIQHIPPSLLILWPHNRLGNSIDSVPIPSAQPYDYYGSIQFLSSLSQSQNSRPTSPSDAQLRGAQACWRNVWLTGKFVDEMGKENVDLLPSPWLLGAAGRSEMDKGKTNKNVRSWCQNRTIEERKKRCCTKPMRSEASEEDVYRIGTLGSVKLRKNWQFHTPYTHVVVGWTWIARIRLSIATSGGGRHGPIKEICTANVFQHFMNDSWGYWNTWQLTLYNN